MATGLSKGGISLRFINYQKDSEFDNLSRLEDIERSLSEANPPRGLTPIGTRLLEKIIEPILEKAEEGILSRPVMVFIITDGEVFLGMKAQILD